MNIDEAIKQYKRSIKASLDDKINAAKKEAIMKTKTFKKKEDKIRKIYEESKNDDYGFWMERSFSEYAYETEALTDTVARLVPDTNCVNCSVFESFNKSEKAVLLSDAINIIKHVLDKYPEKYVEIFFLWCDGTLREVIEENLLSQTETVGFIKKVVAECRSIAGSSSFFPFINEIDELERNSKKIKCWVSVKKFESGTSIPANEDGRVYLTPEEKSMTLERLATHLKNKYPEHKIGYSRGRIGRLRRAGFFMKPGAKNKTGGGKIFNLSIKDKALTKKEIRKKYGVSLYTAKNALSRGYFIINSKNKRNVPTWVIKEADYVY